jgi:hypothetical protein
MLVENDKIEGVLREVRGNPRLEGALCLKGEVKFTVKTHSRTTNLPMRGESPASLRKSFLEGRRKIWNNYTVTCDGGKRGCPVWRKCEVTNGMGIQEEVANVNEVEF